MSTNPTAEGLFDVLIIGGGPAGFSCAMYFGRFNRSAAVVTAGDSRALLIPRTWNVPGHFEGIPGPQLLARLCTHAQDYGATVVSGRVEEVSGRRGAFVARLEDGRALRARFLVLATGVHDVRPDIPDLERYDGRGLRYCPICDGFEVNGKRLAIFGRGDFVARHALFLTTFTKDITILMNGLGSPDDISPEYRAQLERHGIAAHAARVEEVMGDGPEIRGFRLVDGTTVEVDRAYGAMDIRPRSDLAREMGVVTDEQGFIKVDDRGRTSVDGVYAIGDVVNQDYAQIVIAMGQAAVAAIHIQNAHLSEG